HALFDFPSMDIFLHDLNLAYTTGQLPSDNDDATLRYIDYAMIEHEMAMSGASMFWLDALHDCDLDRPLSLPYDRHRLTNEHRTGRGTSVCFDFGCDLSNELIRYASSHDVSIRQVSLAIYYVFLFKLTNGEKDLCTGMNTDGRYRDELKSVIGMFANTIPLRCRLDAHWNWNRLIVHVSEMLSSSMKYSYFPLQRILAQHPHVVKPAFLDSSFEYRLFSRQRAENEVIIGESTLTRKAFSVQINEDEIMSKFDFTFIIQHESNTNQLACTINASLDLFNVTSVNKIAQRIQTMLSQLFISDTIYTQKSICDMQLALPHENLLIQSLNNTQVSHAPTPCIHTEFVRQATIHQQKLAVELDEQSLTYAELLHYVQVLSLHLLSQYRVAAGDVVCQCVERSLSMVS
ncbi:unnamed protein product, partial [Adineta ricciae]